MSKKKITTKVDDLDGSSNAQTYRFGVGDQMFEIDLSPVNAARFRQTMGGVERRLAKYVENARPVEPKNAGNVNSVPSSTIREWAKQQGLPISDLGTIPVQIRKMFADAHTNN